jgi:hypothetical protein
LSNMKKLIFTFTFFLLCLFIIGCTNDYKQKAQKFDSKYATTVFSIWDKLDLELENAKTHEDDMKITDGINKSSIPNTTKLLAKLEKENIPANLEPMKLSLTRYCHNLVVVLNELADTVHSGTKNGTKIQELHADITKLYEERLRYNNEYSIVNNGASSFELTLDNYRKIEIGDNYRSVISKFKMPGNLSSSYTHDMTLIGKRTLDTYEWEFNSGYVRIVFENGKVHMLEQRNLK